MRDSALIGYSGFVGSNLMRQHQFTNLYDSKNIDEIHGANFDIVACAAAPGIKWCANQNPDEDRDIIQTIIGSLRQIKTNKLILISTVDVYPSPVMGVTENKLIDKELLQPYGKHRRILEEFVSSNFNSLIIRLPAIFGNGLKKNVIYDMFMGDYSNINPVSTMQFYYLEHLWSDIDKAIKNNIKIINLATEPIELKKIAKNIFNINLSKNESMIQKVQYDMHTEYGRLWNNDVPYLYLQESVLTDMNFFINNFKI